LDDIAPDRIIPNNSANGAAEFAYGVTDWFEQGLYLLVYSLSSEGRGPTINGFKVRELFVRPHTHDHTFFYGVNFEFSVNAKYWESRGITLRDLRRRVHPDCLLEASSKPASRLLGNRLWS
jgi:hypothetical protein